MKSTFCPRWLWWLSCALLIFLAAVVGACSPDNGSDDDSGQPADDESPTTDDDTADDDSDDDGADDDSGDDDTSAPDDDADDDEAAFEIVSNQLVDGGFPGYGRASIALAGDTVVIATTFGRDVVLYTRQADGTWSRETLAENATVPTVTADANGALHVVYYLVADKFFYYATNRSGSWVHQSIPTEPVDYGTAEEKPDLAIDEAGQVHVCLVTGPIELDYARLVDGEWQVEFVDAGYIGDCDLALDHQGSVHLAYDKSSGPGWVMRYAHRDNSGWRIEDAGSSDESASVTLLLDVQEVPHLFYHYKIWGTGDYFGHARREGEDWQFEIINDSSSVDPDYRIAGFLDRDDRLNALYADAASGELRYSVRENGSWSREVIASDLYVNWSTYWLNDMRWNPAYWTDGVRDAQGVLHLVATDPHRGGIYYYEGEPGNWQASLVDQAGIAGGYLDAAIDAQDRLQVVYTDEADNTVKYFALSNGEPSVEIAYTSEQSIFSQNLNCLSLALDPDVTPCAAFEDGSLEGFVLLTREENGLWTIERSPIGEIVQVGFTPDGTEYVGFDETWPIIMRRKNGERDLWLNLDFDIGYMLFAGFTQFVTGDAEHAEYLFQAYDLYHYYDNSFLFAGSFSRDGVDVTQFAAGDWSAAAVALDGEWDIAYDDYDNKILYRHGLQGADTFVAAGTRLKDIRETSDGEPVILSLRNQGLSLSVRVNDHWVNQLVNSDYDLPGSNFSSRLAIDHQGLFHVIYSLQGGIYHLVARRVDRAR